MGFIQTVETQFKTLPKWQRWSIIGGLTVGLVFLFLNLHGCDKAEPAKPLPSGAMDPWVAPYYADATHPRIIPAKPQSRHGAFKEPQ